PAYRPATEKALVTGLFLWTRFAGDSSRFPAAREFAAVSLEPLGPGTRPAPSGCAGVAPNRADHVTSPSRHPQVEVEEAHREAERGDAQARAAARKRDWRRPLRVAGPRDLGVWLLRSRRARGRRHRPRRRV